MKNFFCFYLAKKEALDVAWEELQKNGVDVSYGSEEGRSKLIYGYWDDAFPFPSLQSISKISPAQLPQINWEEQWASHGLNYADGFVHLDVGKKLILKPGPGFGDLSHPTTQLMIEIMPMYVPGKAVIDIGCGSGVLSVAAIAMGSPFAYGIDIDLDSLQHASMNAQLNHLEENCDFFLPEDFIHPPSQPFVVMMNMIMSEQKVAWQSLPSLHYTQGYCLTSGILIEEKEFYIDQAKQWGWDIKSVIQKEEWLAFVFFRL